MSREHEIKHDMIEKGKFCYFNNRVGAISPIPADIMCQCLMLQGDRQDVMNICAL